jgi:hypothetical protein
MAVELQKLGMIQDNRKFSTASTSAGDSASMHSWDENMYSDLKMHATHIPYLASAWAAQNGSPADLSSSNTTDFQHYAYTPEDEDSDSVNRFPDTREPSLEPPCNANHYDWHEEYFAELCGQHKPPRKSSREPPLQRGVANQPAEPYQTMVFVPQTQPTLFVHGQPANMMFPMNNGAVMQWPVQPTTAATQMPSGAPTQGKEPSVPQPVPVASVQPASSTSTPTISAAEQEEQTAAEPSNASGKAKRGRRSLKSQKSATLNKMSADQKDALCKYIYDMMVQKGLNNPEGHLLADVFAEVCKELMDNDYIEGRRNAQDRLDNLLRSSPEYFHVFRREVRVARHSGWFGRKAERMVRLVPEKQK